VLRSREFGELTFRVEAGIRSRRGSGRHSGVLSGCRTGVLLARGWDSTVLKGTEVTAYTKSNASVEAEYLPFVEPKWFRIGGDDRIPAASSSER
jgi:hypothetical protein